MSAPVPNTQSAQPAIILVAIANNLGQSGHRLTYLNAELAAISEALQPAIRSGLCKVVPIADATLAKIHRAFLQPDWRDRIVIFHFAGHADGVRLLLEGPDGEAAAYADGLAAFLGQQRGLQLVFLNGCSTALQVNRLLTEGVPVVMATNQQIDDRNAMEFARLFYQSLAGDGISIERAYNEAAGLQQSAIGSPSRAYFWAGQQPLEDDRLRWPWERPRTLRNNQSALQWSLRLGAQSVLPAMGQSVRSKPTATSSAEPAEIASLQRQLTLYRENLSLIEERMSEYVESTSIPLQLIRNKQRTEQRIHQLEQELGIG